MRATRSLTRVSSCELFDGIFSFILFQMSLEHERFRGANFFKLRNPITSDIREMTMSFQARTSGFKHAHPGSSTHIQVQARTSGFKHAHPGSSTQTIPSKRCFREWDLFSLFLLIGYSSLKSTIANLNSNTTVENTYLS